MGSVECIKPDYIQELHSEWAQYKKWSWKSTCKLLSYLFAIKLAPCTNSPLFSRYGPFCAAYLKTVVPGVFSEFLNMEKIVRNLSKKIAWKHHNYSSFIFMVEDSWSLDVQDVYQISNFVHLFPMTFLYLGCSSGVEVVERRYTSRHNECETSFMEKFNASLLSLISTDAC